MISFIRRHMASFGALVPWGRWGIRASFGIATVAMTGVLLGCGSSNTPTTEANAVPVALHLNQGSYSVSSRRRHLQLQRIPKRDVLAPRRRRRMAHWMRRVPFLTLSDRSFS